MPLSTLDIGRSCLLPGKGLVGKHLVPAKSDFSKNDTFQAPSSLGYTCIVVDLFFQDPHLGVGALDSNSE